MDNRPTKVYTVDGEDLFYRSYLFSLFGWVWYLHHYLRSDPDRGLHSHPFKAIAFILCKGYTEERIVGFNEAGLVISERKVHPGAINRIDQHIFHKLRLDKVETKCGYVQPTSWSLFICKYIPNQTWGFLRKYDSINPETSHTFMFVRAGQAELEHMWWKTAPKGKFVAKIKV